MNDCLDSSPVFTHQNSVTNKSMCYTSNQLLLLNKHSFQISSTLQNTLSLYGIGKQTNNHQKVKKNKRGTRGGVRKQRKINVLTSNPFNINTDQSRGICSNNLININTKRNFLDKTSNFKMPTVMPDLVVTRPRKLII